MNSSDFYYPTPERESTSRSERKPTSRDLSTLIRELDESLDVLRWAIDPQPLNGAQTAAVETQITRAALAWLNFIRPLGIKMTFSAASDFCVITAVLCDAYPGPFPDLPTARNMLRTAGIDARCEALHDYARLLSAVGERLAGNLTGDGKEG